MARYYISPVSTRRVDLVLTFKVGGTVVETKSDGPLEIESKGKTVSKEGTEDNAAVSARATTREVYVKQQQKLTYVPTGPSQTKWE